MRLNVPQKPYCGWESGTVGLISVPEPKTRGLFIREKIGGYTGGAFFNFNFTALKPLKRSVRNEKVFPTVVETRPHPWVLYLSVRVYPAGDPGSLRISSFKRLFSLKSTLISQNLVSSR